MSQPGRGTSGSQPEFIALSHLGGDSPQAPHWWLSLLPSSRMMCSEIDNHQTSACRQEDLLVPRTHHNSKYRQYQIPNLKRQREARSWTTQNLFLLESNGMHVFIIYSIALVRSSLDHCPGYTQSSNSSSDVMTLLPILTVLPITLRRTSSLLGVTLSVLQELALPTSTFIFPDSLLPSLSSHSKCSIYLTPHQVVKSSHQVASRDNHSKQKEEHVLSPTPLARVISGITSYSRPLWLTAYPCSQPLSIPLIPLCIECDSAPSLNYPTTPSPGKLTLFDVLYHQHLAACDQVKINRKARFFA